MTGFGTYLFTLAKGKLIGQDPEGNRYYVERNPPKTRREKRWVIFKGDVEASCIPPEWHAWLHYTSQAPLTGAQRQSWQKPHEANHTGTKTAYLPPGHDMKGGKRERATGDYQAWAP